VRFDHPAQQIVLQDYIHAVTGAEARVEQLTRQIEELLPQWSMAPVVEALQAVNRLPKVTPDRRAKRTPGEHPFVRFSGAILPPRPMQLLSRRAERRSRTAALSAAARRACS